MARRFVEYCRLELKYLGNSKNIGLDLETSTVKKERFHIFYQTRFKLLFHYERDIQISNEDVLVKISLLFENGS